MFVFSLIEPFYEWTWLSLETEFYLLQTRSCALLTVLNQRMFATTVFSETEAVRNDDRRPLVESNQKKGCESLASPMNKSKNHWEVNLLNGCIFK